MLCFVYYCDLLYNSELSLKIMVILSSFFLIIGSCDFESGLCTWHNTLQGDQFDWTINQGRTSSQNTGPQADHSLGTPNGNFGQKYLYFAFHLEYL